MQDPKLPLGHHTGPREHWPSKVQILGGPDQGWALQFDPKCILAFLSAHLPNVSRKERTESAGEINMDVAYDFPLDFVNENGWGTMRLSPPPGLFFDTLPYGVTYDLLEHLWEFGNTEIVVAFDEWRAQFFVPGSNRNDGIFRLTESVHTPLSEALFPGSWGPEDSDLDTRRRY